MVFEISLSFNSGLFFDFEVRKELGAVGDTSLSFVVVVERGVKVGDFFGFGKKFISGEIIFMDLVGGIVDVFK